MSTAALLNHWKAIATSVAVVCAAIWGAVTWADDKLRKVEQVPAIATTQAEHTQRLRDLEAGSAHYAAALKEIQRELSETNQTQMAMLREILQEVRDGR